MKAPKLLSNIVFLQLLIQFEAIYDTDPDFLTLTFSYHLYIICFDCFNWEKSVKMFYWIYSYVYHSGINLAVHVPFMSLYRYRSQNLPPTMKLMVLGRCLMTQNITAQLYIQVSVCICYWNIVEPDIINQMSCAKSTCIWVTACFKVYLVISWVHIVHSLAHFLHSWVHFVHSWVHFLHSGVHFVQLEHNPAVTH